MPGGGACRSAGSCAAYSADVIAVLSEPVQPLTLWSRWLVPAPAAQAPQAEGVDGHEGWTRMDRLGISGRRTRGTGHRKSLPW